MNSTATTNTNLRRITAPAKQAARVAELLAENARLKFQLEQAQSREQAAMQAASEFEQMHADLTRYAPEIEARRADYEKLGDCLQFFAALESERAPSILELESDYEESRGVLLEAFWSHLRTLTCEKLEWFELRTFRKFYAEMRLWVDQLEYERKQKYKEQ